MKAVIDIGYFFIRRILFLRTDEGMGCFIKIENGQFLFKEGRFVMKGSVFGIGAAGPVKGIDVFAVILDARAIDV